MALLNFEVGNLINRTEMRNGGERWKENYGFGNRFGGNSNPVPWDSSSDGAYILRMRGGIECYDSLESGPIWAAGADYARDLELTPDGTGAYIMALTGWCQGYGTAASNPLGLNGEWSVDLGYARDLELTHDGNGAYLIGTNGDVFGYGNVAGNPAGLPSTWSLDEPRALVLTTPKKAVTPPDTDCDNDGIGDACEEGDIDVLCAQLGVIIDAQVPPIRVDKPYKNHGAYVSKVAHLADTLVAAECHLSDEDAEALHSCLVSTRAKSDVGKK